MRLVFGWVLCLLASDPSRTVWWAIQRFAAAWLGRLLGDESNWARGDKRWVIVGDQQRPCRFAHRSTVKPQTQHVTLLPAFGAHRFSFSLRRRHLVAGRAALAQFLV